ncbi:unnamed protein product [Darwinula stevensoni]|uniref:FH1/FH2 domain-containing protein 3 n=1 Tax=Darwinula stevensoni TaxID=69355 RepID=A0A7R8X1V6_9CRUS|nr:unnamed protein product [Darwinula stevensoni]CAG0882676.1 unnamed protein product [Darwinula stevensoni]
MRNIVGPVFLCKVQFLNDLDPFSYGINSLEPLEAPEFSFNIHVPLMNQIPALMKVLRAPHNVSDVTLQVYKDMDFGSYLDIEATLNEQLDEFDGFFDNPRNSLVVRCQLSVRVHIILEKLMNSEGRELRRALFSLKQIFQDDKDLVRGFVENDGLGCLVKIGLETDQNYQNYILRALGQVMLYVDGMNGVMDHNETIQWLYMLISSKHRLVVKTALKLLLVFIEYTETNCLRLIKAIHAVDMLQELTPWYNLMLLLYDFDCTDWELLTFAMKLVNNTLQEIIDRDTFFSQVDCLNRLGMEKTAQHYLCTSGIELGLIQEVSMYQTRIRRRSTYEERTEDLGALDLTPRSTFTWNSPGAQENMDSLLGDPGVANDRHISTNFSKSKTSGALNKFLPQTNGNDGVHRACQPSQSFVFRQDPTDHFSVKLTEITPAMRKRREEVNKSKAQTNEDSSSVSSTSSASSSGDSSDSENSSIADAGSPSKQGSPKQKSFNQLDKRASSRNLCPSSVPHSAQPPWTKLPKIPGPSKSEVNIFKVMDKKNREGQTEQQSNLVSCNSFAPSDLKKQDSCVLKKSWLLGMMYSKERDGGVGLINEKVAEESSIDESETDGSEFRESQVKRQSVNEELSGVVSRAKESLNDQVNKSKSRLEVPLPGLPKQKSNKDLRKSENDIQWEKLLETLDRPLKLCDLDFTDLKGDDDINVCTPNTLRLNFFSQYSGDVPPPPPLGGIPPPPPFSYNEPPPAPPHSKFCRPSQESSQPSLVIRKNKKTVKLFWREIRDDSVIQKLLKDQKMLWDEIQPVKLDTSKLEYLFENRAKDITKEKQMDAKANKEISILDTKRSNVINIALTKLPPPRAIKAAILKMDATIINKEGIEKILTLLPTTEEKQKIAEAQLNNPDVPFGTAEQFLQTLASVSEVEARLKLWAFKLNFENAEQEIAEPLMDLKQGMEVLQASTTFKNIMAILLSIGNFLNGAEARGFFIDYLTKVPEVKDTVHKHTLVYHVSQMMVEMFPDSKDLYSEIGALTRASKVDFEELAANLEHIEVDCKASWEHLKAITKHDTSPQMKAKLSEFLSDCAERIMILTIVHRRIMNRYRKFLLWLGIPPSQMHDIKTDRICRIISEFALEYRTTRERVLQQIEKKQLYRQRNKTRGKMITEVKEYRKPEEKNLDQLTQLLCDSSDTEGRLRGRTPVKYKQRRNTEALPKQITNVKDRELMTTLMSGKNTSDQVGATQRRRPQRARNSAPARYERRSLKHGLTESQKNFMYCLPLITALYTELLVYYLTAHSWPQLTQRDFKNPIRVLLVADPQIVGELFEPRKPIGNLFRWDADKEEVGFHNQTPWTNFIIYVDHFARNGYIFQKEKGTKHTEVDLLIGAHTHRSRIRTWHRGTPFSEDVVAKQDEYAFDTTEKGVEIIVPTCSYRMGVTEMGYGFLEIFEDRKMRYAVLWLPQRFSHIWGLLFMTSISFLFTLLHYVKMCMERHKSWHHCKYLMQKVHTLHNI